MSFIEPLRLGPNRPVAPPAIAGAPRGSAFHRQHRFVGGGLAQIGSWVVEDLTAAVLT